MIVRELITELLSLPGFLEVEVEGCDCTRKVTGVEYRPLLDTRVLITSF